MMIMCIVCAAGDPRWGRNGEGGAGKQKFASVRQLCTVVPLIPVP